MTIYENGFTTFNGIACEYVSGMGDLPMVAGIIYADHFGMDEWTIYIALD